ncbi:lytic transglycosylase domain-containing protein [Vibrio hepatarius]|uniref:lytic transglycosylase domain-containing protein n=1 Tax=Vibrio hepatarius TaxID=171383 RepID=UPI00142E505F|nr:lytic transglycosylase domain-containing protein [Vibrio hepatarius]NIY83726.1 lytic transglycosylase domain-containing protein [Vibrio hepatarius]
MLLELSALIPLLNSCQSQVDASILKRLIDTESSRNPYAIGVVGVKTVNQPKTKLEAIQIAIDLDNRGFRYSLGLMQINNKNFPAYGMTIETAFDPCTNINVGADIYAKCYHRAKANTPSKAHQLLLDDAASCYYANNFTQGYQSEGANGLSYVEKFNREKKLPSDIISESYDSFPEPPQPSKPSPPTQPHVWDVFGDFTD